MALTSTISGSLNIDALFKEVLTDGGFIQGTLALQFALGPVLLANGSSVGQVNAAFAESKSAIGSGVTTSYDLKTLVNNAGQAIDIDDVVLIAVKQTSTAAANFLLVGPNVTNPLGVVGQINAGEGIFADVADRIVLSKATKDSSGGSWFVWQNDTGVAVDATHKVIDVITDGSSANNSWDILIVGRT